MASDDDQRPGGVSVSASLPETLALRERLTALYNTGLMDSAPEERFDRLTRLVSACLATPVALVSLVDTQRQFFKSAFGLPEPWNSQRETPLSHSFCQHVVHQAAPLVVDDALNHPLVADNLAIPDLGVQAYLGMPLLSADGAVLGSLCAIDSKPRHWTPQEKAILGDFAKLVEEQIALREHVRELAAFDAQRELIQGELGHRIKNIFAVISSLLLISSKTDTDLDDFVRNVSGRIQALSKAHDYILGSPAHADSDNPGLASLLQALLAPFQRNQDQVRIHCGPIPVGAQSAAAVSLVIHELATNASKYGALSVPEGHVTLTCTETGGRLTMDWSERGGPVVTGVPERRGFGSKMVTRTIESQLYGTLTHAFTAAGLDITISLPTDQLLR